MPILEQQKKELENVLMQYLNEGLQIIEGQQSSNTADFLRLMEGPQSIGELLQNWNAPVKRFDLTYFARQAAENSIAEIIVPNTAYNLSFDLIFFEGYIKVALNWMYLAIDHEMNGAACELIQDHLDRAISILTNNAGYAPESEIIKSLVAHRELLER